LHSAHKHIKTKAVTRKLKQIATITKVVLEKGGVGVCMGCTDVVIDEVADRDAWVEGRGLVGFVLICTESVGRGLDADLVLEGTRVFEGEKVAVRVGLDVGVHETDCVDEGVGRTSRATVLTPGRGAVNPWVSTMSTSGTVMTKTPENDMCIRTTQCNVHVFVSVVMVVVATTLGWFTCTEIFGAAGGMEAGSHAHCTKKVAMEPLWAPVACTPLGSVVLRENVGCGRYGTTTKLC
jgi:hypothetical protein